MSNSTIQNVNSLYTVFKGVNTTFDFWNHPTFDVAVLNQFSQLFWRSLANKSFRILCIKSQTLNVG